MGLNGFLFGAEKLRFISISVGCFFFRSAELTWKKLLHFMNGIRRGVPHNHIVPTWPRFGWVHVICELRHILSNLQSCLAVISTSRLLHWFQTKGCGFCNMPQLQDWYDYQWTFLDRVCDGFDVCLPASSKVKGHDLFSWIVLMSYCD